MKRVCGCAEHVDGAPTVIGTHSYTCEEQGREHDLGWRWRWVCSCGRRGMWTYQSDSAAYHKWLNHTKKES